MNETQKAKKKFRQTKEWKNFRKLMFSKSGKVDRITLKPLRKGWQLHHLLLDETRYAELDENNFVCLNNLTHKFVHWLYTYYQKDPAIIDRIRAELEKMKEINIDKN
jgi:hypothetical protein